MTGALIGVDWGTSSLRAFLFDATGTVIQTRADKQGISSVQPAEFETVFDALLNGWQGPPVLLSGMVGSRNGWREAPYVAGPAGLAEIAAGAIVARAARVDAHGAHQAEALILPGVSFETLDGVMDVMRGEETQILGVMADADDGLVIAPGTHSKWAQVRAGRILSCATYMTGEMLALLSTHSILGRLMSGRDWHERAFDLGVTRALARPDLLGQLFSVRTEGLFGRIPGENLFCYLSGVLIGAEIGAGLRAGIHGQVRVIGRPDVTGAYVRALMLAGMPDATQIDGEHASAAGLWRVHQTMRERSSAGRVQTALST